MANNSREGLTQVARWRGTPTSTAWRVLATDGTSYATLALLAAAGKTVFPGSPSDVGVVEIITARVEDTSDGATAGVGFYIDFNRATAPTVDTAHLVANAGEKAEFPVGQCHNVWVFVTEADQMEIIGYG